MIYTGISTPLLQYADTLNVKTVQCLILSYSEEHLHSMFIYHINAPVFWVNLAITYHNNFYYISHVCNGIEEHGPVIFKATIWNHWQIDWWKVHKLNTNWHLHVFYTKLYELWVRWVYERLNMRVYAAYDQFKWLIVYGKFSCFCCYYILRNFDMCDK